MPTILVLSGCGLSSAGDRAQISAFCAHVLELDLSHNLLQDWRQVETYLHPRGTTDKQTHRKQGREGRKEV
ncbi:Tubulin-specific chaperone cofactor E-like protein [Liparis tanakae]|uniref:Tubulin-specific chaperone cofactor E-like protein n=1 Tax=Liparis tanakae TaxID=230148 RepID=A0A4Z2EH83_9TELE|nr:Tubulin-specific chaperone cofactor E-like protein [Liparis tanakae]